MPDTNLNVNITANNQAVGSLTQLRTTLQSLEAMMSNMKTQAEAWGTAQTAASQRTQAALQKEIDLLRQQIALKEEAAGITMRTARQQAEAENKAIDDRTNRVRQQMRLNNQRVQAERSQEDANIRATAEAENAALAAREARIRQQLKAHNERVYAERAAEDQALAAAKVKERQEAEYENRQRDAVADRQRREAEYTNAQMTAAAAKQRKEAEYENARRDAVYKRQQAEAELENRQRDAEARARSRSAAGIIAAHPPSAAAADAAAAASLRGTSALGVQKAAVDAATAAYNRQQRAIEAVAAAMKAAAAAGASASEVEAAGARAATMAFEGQASAMRNAAGGAGVLGREMRHVVGFFDAISRGQFGQALSSIGAGLRDAGARAGVLGVGIGALFAVMAGRHILKSAEELGRWATEARAAASAAGMSLEAYTRLQGALTLTGLKATEADGALRQMAEHVGEAIADPTSKAASGFRALGISMDALKSTGGDLNKIMDLVAEAWARSADGANKSAAAEAALGRSFEQLIPLIKDGVDALDQKKKKAEELGLTLDEKTSKSLTETSQKVNELSAQIRGAGIQAMVEWGPHIQSVVGDLQALVSWISTAISWIGKLESAISTVTGATGRLANYLSTTGQDLGHRILHGLGLPDVTAPTPTPATSASTAAAQEAKRREREALEAPKIDIAPIVSSAKLREQIALEAEEAETAAAKKALAEHKNSRQAREAEDRAYIEVLKRHLNDEGVDRDALQKEIAAKELSLTNTQIAEANKRGGASKQATRDFIAEEKLKIAEADGNSQKIAQIYDEEIAKLKELAAQHKATAAQVAEAEAAKVKAVNKARIDEIKETERAESLAARAEKAMQAASRVQMDPEQQVAALQKEASALEASAQARVQELEAIMATSEEGTTTYKKAAEEILNIITTTKEQEVQLYEKAEAAYKKSIAGMTQMFDQMGSQVESAMSSIAQAIVAPTTTIYKVGLTSIRESNRGQEIAKAIGKLVTDLGTDILKEAASGISKLVGKSLASMLGVTGEAATGGIGSVLGAKFSSLLGIGGKAPEMAGYTGATSGLTAFTAALTKATAALTGHSANTTANSAATSANTGTTSANTVATTGNTGATTADTGVQGANTAAVGSGTVAHGANAVATGTSTVANTGNTIATAANTVATTANSAAESGGGILGFIGKLFAFESGGIVPSAQGGMVVGGVGGGQMAILHPQEMVLPAHISQGIQSMIARTGNTFAQTHTANLNYSPTINTSSRSRGGTGMSRGEFNEMMNTHGGSMLGEARNLMRSGWRPS